MKTEYPRCLRHFSRLGTVVNLSADELERSMEEFKSPYCDPCMKIGRAAGYGRQTAEDPKDAQKRVLRHYRGLLDLAMHPNEVNVWVDSTALDRDITPEMKIVLAKYKEARLIEMTMGIL